MLKNEQFLTTTDRVTKDYFCPVSRISTEKCPNHVCDEFCNNMQNKSKLSIISSLFELNYAIDYHFCIIFRPSIKKFITTF